MSMPEPINPYDSPETVKPGMSGSTKVLLGVGIGCGVLALLCCGGVIIGGIFVGRSVQQAASEDPEAIRAATQSIVDIEIPKPLDPELCLNGLWIPLVGTVTLAVWSETVNDRPQSVLVLFQLDNEAVTPDMLKAQFEMQIQQQQRNDWKEVTLEGPETIEKEIAGSPVEITFGKGKRPEDDREVWQATGAFDGRGGAAMLFMQLDADSFTEEQARAIIDTMK